MNIKLKTILLLGFIFFAENTFAQSKKLIKNFKFGAIGYTLFESHKPSKSVNDTTFYLLYRVSNKKILGKEIKKVVEKRSGKILTSAKFTVNSDNIDFYHVLPDNNIAERIYTQNKNGLLSFKSNLIPAVAELPKPVSAIKTPVDDGPYCPTVVDTMPEFPGGVDALRNYIAQNLEYPDEAADIGLQGTVVATFTISKDGSITNILIDKKLSKECDKEVIRVLRKMPKWRPAKLQGKEVNYLYRIPIRFVQED